jgi:isopenicillin-N epimerase
VVSDGTRLRENFLLDPSVTFLNHGSFGATPRAVFETYQEWQLELERQPVLFLARRLDGLLTEARAAHGAYVGADPDDLVFVPNATAAVNIAAWPTRALFLSHHTSTTAMTLPVDVLCRRARAAGIRTIVDGAHVPGHLPLNLRELDADYYAGNCHKSQFHFCKTTRATRVGGTKTASRQGGPLPPSGEEETRRIGPPCI